LISFLILGVAPKVYFGILMRVREKETPSTLTEKKMFATYKEIVKTCGDFFPGFIREETIPNTSNFFYISIDKDSDVDDSFVRYTICPEYSGRGEIRLAKYKGIKSLTKFDMFTELLKFFDSIEDLEEFFSKEKEVK
jgi:hypothetical protein